MALALVMIYQATHLVNFAQGEMAMFSTYIAWAMIDAGFPYWAAFVPPFSDTHRLLLDRSTNSKFVFFDYCKLSVKIKFTELEQPSTKNCSHVHFGWRPRPKPNNPRSIGR